MPYKSPKPILSNFRGYIEMSFFIRLSTIVLLFFTSGFASEIFSFQGAVIGYGNMGQMHASYFSDLCKIPVAVVEIDEHKTKLALDNGYEVYPSLKQVLQDKKIDFVAICTPTYLHFRHIQEALELNLPIFVEKPIVKTGSEAKEIAKFNDSFIFVGEVEHYNPVLKSATDFANDPESLFITRSVDLKFFIGSDSPWFLDPELSGGIVTDLMIHDITLLIEKFGIPKVKEVKGSKNLYSSIDEVDVQLEFKNFTANLHADWCSSKSENPISVIWEIRCNRKVEQFICDDYLTNLPDERNPYFIQDRDFLRSLKLSKPIRPFEIYLQAVEVACEINTALERLSVIN